MHARMQPRRKPHVARDDQEQPARAADPRQGFAQRGSGGIAIMAEYHAAEATRQARGGGERVGQACGIGKEPQDRQVTAAT